MHVSMFSTLSTTKHIEVLTGNPLGKPKIHNFSRVSLIQPLHFTSYLVYPEIKTAHAG